MPSLRPFVTAVTEAVPRIAKALTSPSLAAEGERGTAALPAELEKALKQGLPVRDIAADVPFTGPSEVAPHVTQTHDPRLPLETRVQHIRDAIGAAFQHTPGLDKADQKAFYFSRAKHDAAASVAAEDMRSWLMPISKKDSARRANQLWRYMTLADDVAQAERDGQQMIQGLPIEKWIAARDAHQRIIDADPEMQEAFANIRGGLDEMFEDMLKRGWITRDRRLEEYTPKRKINAVLKGLAAHSNEDNEALYDRLLSAMQHRGEGGTAIRDSDIMGVVLAARREYYQKVAQHDLFAKYASDPTINLTRFYRGKDNPTLPRGLSAYRPGAGAMGSTMMTPEGSYFHGLLDSLDPAGNLQAGEPYVFPTALVDAFKEFHPPSSPDTQNKWMTAGRKIAKSLTVYNPRNTNLNRFTDLPMALMGLPGEKARPLGILRFVWDAQDIAYKGAFGKDRRIIKVNGQEIDAWDWAVRHGLTSSTVAHDVGGNPLPADLQRYMSELDKKDMAWFDGLKDVMMRERVAVEAIPRIAAGLEAFARTGDPAEFGRVGRSITLTYGAGAPKLARLPVFRAISPFMTYMSLATARVAELVAAPGSRGRTIAALLAPPMAAMMWNRQNDEYLAVEDALPPFERDQMHVIVPGPDPSKPRLDINGKPVVLRFRYFFTEEVAKMVGLGNLPSRIHDVLRGKDTPVQMAKAAVQGPIKTFAGLMTIPNIVHEIATGKTDDGRELSITERMLRLFPATRILTEPTAAAKSYGPQAGLRSVVNETLGIGYASVARKDTQVLDARIRDTKRELTEARAMLRTAVANGPPEKARKALLKVQKLAAELERLADEYRQAKTEGFNPERVPPTANAEKDAAVKSTLEGLK